MGSTRCPRPTATNPDSSGFAHRLRPNGHNWLTPSPIGWGACWNAKGYWRATPNSWIWAQHTAPAGDPGLFLSLFFETNAARNYSGWSNADYDALIADLRAAGDPQARIDLARQAQEMIAAEAPVAFLVTPEWHVGLSPASAGYKPWGSDYYVIRPGRVVTG